MSHAWTHSWCKSPCRDEAVRAAEDNRPGPLPTLEEAIARAGQFMPPQAPQEQNCTEQDNKGDDMRPPTTKTATVENDFAKPAKGSPSLSETGEGQSGMRTERVVLEIQTHSPLPVSEWGWQEIVDDSNVKMVAFSVRVVDEERLPPTIIRLTDEREAARCERDAAIRERDEHKARVDYLELDRKNWCDMSGLHERQANALRARVAKLESAAKLAPAANAEGGSNHAAPAASGAAGTGWLTAEERRLIEIAVKAQRDPYDITGTSQYNARVLRDLLARSSPPEVVLEDFTPDAVRNLDTKYLAGWDQCMALAKRAIRDAGVKVKEVGRE